MGKTARGVTLTRLLPGLQQDLRPWTPVSVIAGLTVAAYLVPQVMAYATVAGLPPIVGLWAALPALLIYPLLGTSRLLSLGPESSVALMTAAVVGPLALGDPSRYAVLVAGLALIVGVVGVAASLLRLGFLGDLLSHPVMLGYMAGIGMLMIEGQIDQLLGINTTAEDVLPHLGEVLQAVGSGEIDLPTALVGGVMLAALFPLARYLPKWPGPLLVVVAGSLFTWVYNAGGGELTVVGAVPQGVPLPQVPAISLEDAAVLLVGGLGVLLVGFTDVALTGRAFQERDDSRPDPNAELRAMSVGNLGAGLLQGMPVSSSGSRTALAQASGARSQAYSFVVAIALVAVLLVAGPLLSSIPRAGLAALVIYAALQLIDVSGFALLWQFDRVEFVLAIVTLVSVLIVGILYGVLIAVGLSVIAMAARAARPHSAALGLVPDLAGMHDIGDFDDAREVPGLLIYRYDSPVFFANSSDFLAQADRLIEERQPGLRWFALNCEAIVDIDATAVTAIDRLLRQTEQEGLLFCLVRAKRELVEQLDRAGLADRIGRDRMYPTLPSLVDAFYAEDE